MDKLRFGTAGIPLSTLREKTVNTMNGIRKVRELGLGAMELEFVRNVNISEELAPIVKETAQKQDVVLTCHGQYYINLNSTDLNIIEASKKRIYHAAKIASLCGAYSMTFHAAYNLTNDKEQVYQKVKSAVQEIMEKLQDEGHTLWVRPETTGKVSQWGELKEILRLSQEVEQVLPTIDFSHLHARTGKNNTLEEFRQIMASVETALGRTALDNMHIHLSGIEYGPKGEKNHLNLQDSDMNYKDLIKAWKEFKIKGAVISESPNIEEDALLMKREYEKK